MSTFLLSRKPFDEQDIAKLRKVASDLQYNLVIVPGTPPENDVLMDILSAGSIEELNLAIADKPFNYEPPTDENPYFFNMLRLNHLTPLFYADSGVGHGNLVATVTLMGLILSLFFVSLVAIILPLIIKARNADPVQDTTKVLWSGALYFCLIGAGFMSVEIALIQRLSVFLGHPTYALGILLFTIILSTGLGSFLSEYLPLTRPPWVFVYPIITALAILLVRFVLLFVLSSMITSPMLNKILVSILVIFPMGVLMGFFFPMGMRLVRSAAATETPWYWALNGIFGVLFSALAVFFSIYFGIATNFYIGVACYTILLTCLPKMYRAAQVNQ